MKNMKKRRARVFKAIAEASLTGLGDIKTKHGTYTIVHFNDTKFGVGTVCDLFNAEHELLYILRDDDSGIAPSDNIMDDVDAIVRIIWGKKPYTVLF